MSRRPPPKTRLFRAGDTLLCPRCGRKITVPDPVTTKHLAWHETHPAAPTSTQATSHYVVFRKAKQQPNSDMGRNRGEWVWWLDQSV